ncbi:MAG: type II secretion system F family protein [Mycobacteriales bacterium]
MAVLAVLLTALAVAALLGRQDEGRLGRVVPAGRPAVRPTGRLPPASAACVLAGLAVALLVAGPVGVALGVALGAGGPRLLARLEPRVRRAEREQLAADLPMVLDLLASCLAGGAALPAAADAVARAVPGPAGKRLAAVSAALAVGCPPTEAWAALARDAPPDRGGASSGSWQSSGGGAAVEDPLAAAARALGRAAEGGAPVAGAVSRLAAESRAEARSRGEQAARRVGVLAVAPLGLCFLPAFVLLGVVPVVVGLAGPLLASF